MSATPVSNRILSFCFGFADFFKMYRLPLSLFPVTRAGFDSELLLGGHFIHFMEPNNAQCMDVVHLKS